MSERGYYKVRIVNYYIFFVKKKKIFNITFFLFGHVSSSILGGDHRRFPRDRRLFAALGVAWAIAVCRGTGNHNHDSTYTKTA